MKHSIVNVTLCCSVTINIEKLTDELGRKPTQKDILAYAANNAVVSSCDSTGVVTHTGVFEILTTFAGEYDGDEHGNATKRPPPRKGIGSY